MYKVSSDKRQSALHRGRLSDWAHGEEYQTDLQQRDNMAAAIQRLEERIHQEPSAGERKRMGREKLVTQGALSVLNKKIKAGNMVRVGLNQYVIQALNEIVPKAQRELIWARARRMQDDDRRRAERLFAEAQG